MRPRALTPEAEPTGQAGGASALSSCGRAGSSPRPALFVHVCAVHLVPQVLTLRSTLIHETEPRPQAIRE